MHTHTQVMNFLIKHIPPSPAYTLMSEKCDITGIIANTWVFLMIPVMLRYFRLSVYIKKQCNASKFSIAQVCDQIHQETYRFMTIKSELFPQELSGANVYSATLKSEIISPNISVPHSKVLKFVPSPHIKWCNLTQALSFMLLFKKRWMDFTEN